MSVSDVYEMIDAQTRAKRKQLPTLKDYNFRDTLNNARATYREIYQNPYSRFMQVRELQPVFKRLPKGSQFGRRVVQADQQKLADYAQEIDDMQETHDIIQQKGIDESGFGNRVRDMRTALDLMYGTYAKRGRQDDMYNLNRDTLIHMVTRYARREGLNIPMIEAKNKSELIHILGEADLNRDALRFLMEDPPSDDADDEVDDDNKQAFLHQSPEGRSLLERLEHHRNSPTVYHI